jgi:hypothetical protein
MSDRLELQLAESYAVAAASDLQSLRAEVDELLPFLTTAERKRFEHAISRAESAATSLLTSLGSLVTSH